LNVRSFWIYFLLINDYANSSMGYNYSCNSFFDMVIEKVD